MTADLSQRSLTHLEGSWLFRTCRRRCIVRALLFSPLLALAVFGSLALLRATFDSLAGPHTVDAAALAAATQAEVDGHDFVRIAVEEAFDSGVEWIEDGDTTPVWAIPVGDRVVLVKAADRPEGHVSGELEDVDWKLQKVFPEEVRHEIARTMIDAESDPRFGLVFANVLVLGLTAILGFVFVRALRWARDPASHPAIRNLAAAGGLAVSSPDVEAELRAPDALRYRGWTFGRTYLMPRQPWSFDIRTWHELVWAYKRGTQHRIYGMIPAGTTWTPVLNFARGRTLELARASFAFGKASNEQGVDEFLEFVAERAPWATFGYSDELKGAWAHDRAGFSAHAARHRDELLRGA